MTRKSPLPVLKVAAAARETLAQALAANALPGDDLEGRHKRFFAFTDPAGRKVGFGGIELYGADGLLRSVVTAEGRRGRSYGEAIVAWLVQYARRQGVRHLYLLTTTAPGFFERCGFVRIPREEAPAGVARSEEFRRLCPPDAICMTLAIKARDAERLEATPERPLTDQQGR